MKTAPQKMVVIRPSSGWAPVNIKEIWIYRELLFFLAWRDISVRYKQTALGALWAIIQPFFTMVVFTIFFSRLAKLPSDGVPYSVFSYSSLLPWTYFSSSLIAASNSLVGNQQLVTKVFFPRLVIPIAAILPPLLDLAIAFTVLICLMAYYGIVPTLNIVWLPVFLIQAVLTALGLSLWFSALNVKYRDVRHTLPFFIQFWLFASPIVYPASLVPEPWRIWYGLNPMTGVVEGFRWALLGTGDVPGWPMLVSVCVTLFILISGAYYFARMERNFADIV